MFKPRRSFIVAEVSANHGQDFARAVTMVRLAKRCGADAVKFQAYTPDTLTIDCRNKYFCIKHSKWKGKTLYGLYKKAYTPWSWFKKLKKISDGLGLTFFATVFDKTSVDFLEELGVCLHKISSFELTDLPLIEYVARTKKPLIMSTGMATISEIRNAVKTARDTGVRNITLLKCVSSYPARAEDMNLNTIPDMQKMFKCQVGLSDHTLEHAVALAAVALGAKVIEKHFILSRTIKTPDSFFSFEPQEFKKLADDIRIVEKALGNVQYGLTKGEKRNRIFRRSLFAVKNIKKGEVFTVENIRSIRPGNGIPPKYFKIILGKKSKKDIVRGTPLEQDAVKISEVK